MCCRLPAARGCPRMPGAREAEGAQESKRRQQWTFVTNSAAGKSPGAQVTWKLKRLQPLSAGPQTHNGRGSGGPWPRACTVPQFLPGQGRAVPAAPVQKSRWGGCPGTQTEWKDPASPWGVPSARPPEEEHAAPVHSLLGGCPGAERGRAPRGWPPGDTGAAGARCTHLASLLSRRAFFARVPLSGERRPALARGQNRPPDAHPPSSLRSENGSWGSSRLLPPHENKMGRAGDARQLSRLGQAQTGGLIHPLVPDPQLLHLKSGNNARPGQWPELPTEGGGGGVSWHDCAPVSPSPTMGKRGQGR